MSAPIPQIPGIYTHVELGMHFARWADQMRHLPTPAMVMSRFGVSRATAYRYVAAYRNCPKAATPALAGRSA